VTIPTVAKDHDKGTMTVTAHFDAPVERVWRLWSDPRQLERWWGPPTYPATVVNHDLTPGGIVNYYMTGPEGDESHGRWRVLAVEAPHRLEFEDDFADADGTPNPEMPTTVITVSLEAGAEGGTDVSIHAIFPTPEAMDQLMDMGMEEGLKASFAQIDGVLAEDSA
jgi:uncharacterized protein YndB with AHSA1/START domain